MTITIIPDGRRYAVARIINGKTAIIRRCNSRKRAETIAKIERKKG